MTHTDTVPVHYAVDVLYTNVSGPWEDGGYVVAWHEPGWTHTDHCHCESYAVAKEISEKFFNDYHAAH